MARGKVVGSSDRQGGEVRDTPMSPKDILATAFHLLGIDPDTTVPDALGRPTAIAGTGEVRPELLGDTLLEILERCGEALQDFGRPYLSQRSMHQHAGFTGDDGRDQMEWKCDPSKVDHSLVCAGRRTSGSTLEPHSRQTRARLPAPPMPPTRPMPPFSKT